MEKEKQSGDRLATKVAEGRANVRKVAVGRVESGLFAAHISTRRNSRLGMVSAFGPTPLVAIENAYAKLDAKAT